LISRALLSRRADGLKVVSRGKSNVPWQGQDGMELPLRRKLLLYVSKEKYRIVFNIIYSRNEILFFQIFFKFDNLINFLTNNER